MRSEALQAEPWPRRRRAARPDGRAHRRGARAGRQLLRFGGESSGACRRRGSRRSDPVVASDRGSPRTAGRHRLSRPRDPSPQGPQRGHTPVRRSGRRDGLGGPPSSDGRERHWQHPSHTDGVHRQHGGLAGESGRDLTLAVGDVDWPRGHWQDAHRDGDWRGRQHLLSRTARGSSIWRRSSEHAAVGAAVASTLAVRQRTGESTTESIVDWLRGRRLLLDPRQLRTRDPAGRRARRGRHGALSRHLDPGHQPGATRDCWRASPVRRCARFALRRLDAVLSQGSGRRRVLRGPTISTARRSRPSAAVSTAFRSRSSSPPPASARSVLTTSWSASTTDSGS